MDLFDDFVEPAMEGLGAAGSQEARRPLGPPNRTRTGIPFDLFP